MTTRAKLRYLTMALLVGYAIVRFAIVKATLSNYGVDPWVFLLIDAVTAIFYVLGIEQLIVAIARPGTRWQKTIGWSVLAVAAFGAPYAYIFISSHELPISFVIGLSVIIVLLLANALLTIRRRLREKKQV